jgi:S-formylglutathione hydrolase FrmB
MIFTLSNFSKLLCAVLLLLGANAHAAKVDTVLTHSNSMHKDIKAVVICPDHYSRHHAYPVLYLLHGFSGDYSDWIKKAPVVAQMADRYNFIIVCPDGNFASWYLDSPVNSEWRYETYISGELINWVDAHYTTIKNRYGRAISGLSMGGYGALYLAFKHQNLYGAAGSMSGDVDLVPFAKQFGLEQVLGKSEDNLQRFKDNSVTNMLDLIKPGALAIIFDCGYSDFFYQINQTFHQQLVERKIPHDFIVRDGGHSWDYWANSIQYQALFFSKYFSKNISE